MHIKHIHCTMEKLAEFMYNEACGDLKAIDTKEYGELIDMIKDLACAEKDARIAKEMEQAEKDDEEEAKRILREMKEEYGEEGGEEMYRRMGYNRNRYSNGRFAPRGRGRRMGYIPPMMRYPYFEDDMMGMDEYDMMPMGYGNGRGTSSMGGNRGNSGSRGMDGGNRGGGDSYGYSDGRGEGSRYGRSYDSYRENRRHYTETKDEKSKKDMEMSMKEYTDDVMDNIKEMWRDADPALRQTMKADLTKMVQQLQ